MANTQLALPDYIVIFGYFALVLIIGLYFRRRQKSAQEYFAGGHQVSWWLAGTSMVATTFAAAI